MISAGAMREAVSLKAISTTTSATTGAVTITESLVANVLAEVYSISSRELLRSAQPLGTITHRVKIRDVGTTPSVRWRVLWRTRSLMVAAVTQHIGGWELSCVEASA